MNFLERLTANTKDRSVLMATAFSTNLSLTEKRKKNERKYINNRSK